MGAICDDVGPRNSCRTCKHLSTPDPVSVNSEEPQAREEIVGDNVDTKLRTKNVFVDTSVHIAAKFVYSSGGFRRLADLAAGDLATVFESQIDLGEIAANIDKAAEEAANGLKRFQREAVGLHAVAAPEVAAFFHPLDKDRVRALLIQEFDSYRARAQTREISLAEADTSLVFRRYFGQDPPFEEKKKSEFPDAFILSALASWCWKGAELMYVISQDKGFRAAAVAMGRGRLMPLESLDEFLNLVVSEQHQAIALVAQRWLGSHGVAVSQGIANAFLEAGFYIEDAEGEVVNVEAEEIRCSRPRLVEVHAGHAVFSLECDVTFTAKITYEDPESGIYDSEDDVMLFMESKTTRVRRSTEIDIEVEILFSEPDGGVRLDPEVNIEEIRLNRGRDIPVAIEDELVEVYPPEYDEYDWYAEMAGSKDDDAPGDEEEDDNPYF